MKVLILGGNGMMGPHVVKALEGEHELHITDINDLDTLHEFRRVDVGDIDEVVAASEGMDAIINLSVLRPDRQLAWDVNARGCYNMMTAAVEHGIGRVVNSGPFYAVAEPTYERFDHGIGPDVPHQPGTYLYAITKSLGQEICRVFTQEHNIYVMDLLFYMLLDSETYEGGPGDSIAYVGHDMTPYTTSWRDCAESFRCALEVDLQTLPSRSECFFVFPDIPHAKFSNTKTRRLLGWKPRNSLERYWLKQ